MEEQIEVRNAEDAPVEPVQMFQEEPSVQTETIETPTSANPITETSNQVPDQESEQDRYKYWQSQADKAKGEMQTLRTELDYYKNGLAPVENMIKQNPQVLENLQSLSNEQPAGYPSQGFQQDSLKEPVAPEKPMNYNEVDALNDPESKSFEFRMAKEQYRDDYLGYLRNADESRNQKMQQQYQQQMRVQQDQMVKQQAHTVATNTYGWDNTKANDFIDWAASPSNITMDSLAKLYELQSNPNPVVQQKTQAMQNQAQRLNVPRTAAVQTGKSEQPRTDEQMFSDALLGR